jgi:hypothetical protein
MSSAAIIGRNLGAQRQGHNWRCACPLGCGYSLSLTNDAEGRLLVHCFGGCEYQELSEALVEYGLFDDDPADIEYEVPPLRQNDRSEPRRIELACATYNQAAPDERIGIYLRSRGITIASPVLKFHAEAPHRLGARLPAMVAPIVDVAGEQTGIHVTFLRHDGAGKADLPREFQPECRGAIRGGAIRLAPHDPARDLIIAEGIETALSAMEIFGLPGWSSVSAAGMTTLELPPSVQRLVIAADNDASGAGQRNAVAAYERWTDEGRAVRIVIPPAVGDFNDVLRQQKSEDASATG